MAPNDAEMAARQGLSDDMDQIAKDMAGLRADLQGLTGDVKRLGGHQIDGQCGPRGGRGSRAPQPNQAFTSHCSAETCSRQISRTSSE